ncbi:zinc transporter ZIP9-B-like isoform X2 [Carassius gibelio]|uniref:zinc transporter ZIP9-B-like isoform X2 n=1 Tax=Carassius gibelio TaxID=101364 RepID=UPI0022780940|nr:zinc transporter ZIP9-B-like isoform X2 [Carassius gibelio]
MDGAWAVILISLAMFVGCLVLGIIPLLINLSEKLQLVTVLGAGLLCGTALSIIIPEGVELIQESWKDQYCSAMGENQNISEINSTLHLAAKKGLRPQFFIGVSLVLGFTLMFVVDQIANYCSMQGTSVLLLIRNTFQYLSTHFFNMEVVLRIEINKGDPTPYFSGQVLTRIS